VAAPYGAQQARRAEPAVTYARHEGGTLMNRFKTTCLATAVALFALSGHANADTSQSAGQIIEDTVITTKVKAALVADPITKALNISVDTANGIVTLSGEVSGAEEELRAIEVARSVDGTVAVTNELEIAR
jgi:osmotically-inducible protein OsmY